MLKKIIQHRIKKIFHRVSETGLFIWWIVEIFALAKNVLKSEGHHPIKGVGRLWSKSIFPAIAGERKVRWGASGRKENQSGGIMCCSRIGNF